MFLKHGGDRTQAGAGRGGGLLYVAGARSGTGELHRDRNPQRREPDLGGSWMARLERPQRHRLVARRLPRRPAARPCPWQPRPQPFDAQVGTDAAGAPVVTYSRCRVTPEMEDAGLYVKGTGTLAEPNTGAGCRLRVLELESGRERSPQVPEPRGVSDTTPAMWRGTLVFARKAAGHGRVSQIMLSLPGHRSRLVTLPHGAVPEGCPQQAGLSGLLRGRRSPGPVHRRADRRLRVEAGGPGVDIDGAWEERVDSLATPRAPAGSRSAPSPARTASKKRVEEEWPAPPLVSGEAALFPS